MQKAIIIINPICHQGKGWKRWLSIRGEVKKRFPEDCTEVVLEKGGELKEILHPIMKMGEPIFIVSAGGDGSVHYQINYLLKEEKENVGLVTLGAIGLGSSNDFLKPFGEKIKGIPVCIKRSGGTMLHDVGIIEYTDENNLEQKEFFIVNASIGVTAQANWNFNHPDAVLRFLKKRTTGAAIVYTAINTILHHQNISLSLRFNEKEIDTPISNINILKLPFVSGSFFYSQPVLRDDGKLGLNICMNMSKRELLSVLKNLQKGKFPGSSKTLTEFTTCIDINAEDDFVFECDGETARARSMIVSILPNVIKVLKN